VSFAPIARRFATIGAATVIGIGGVVVGGVAPAQAASAKTTYTCNTINGPATSDATVKLSLPKTVKAGSTVAARAFKMSVVLPSELVDTLRFFGITSISAEATKLGYSVGSTKVPVSDAKVRSTKVPASGPMKLTLKGKSAAFKAPAAGKHVVTTPKSFTLTIKDQNGNPLGEPVPCKRNKGATSELTTLTTTKARQAVPARRALLSHSS
jgi:hypothetical protein